MSTAFLQVGLLALLAELLYHGAPGIGVIGPQSANLSARVLENREADIRDMA